MSLKYNHSQQHFNTEIMAAILNLTVFSAFVVLCGAQVDVNGELLASKQASPRSGIQDQNSAETGFGGGGGGGIENSKYFHYQHLPEHDKYEFGFRRGNDHHVKERYEKAVPHEGHFKTKVRWADHKGGHGEHYWDYNHAGNGGDGDGEGGYSDPVPTYTDSQNANSNPLPRVYQKRQSDQEVTRRQFTQEPVYSPPAAPRSNPDDHAGFIKSFEDEIGGVQSFEINREAAKQKRNPVKKPVEPNVVKEKKPEIQKRATPQLFFDLETGKVIDEGTGKTYMLQPIEN